MFRRLLRQPCIPVSSKNVKILHSPSAFYATLLEIIGRAQRHIYLSSLYLGASESLLINSLKSALLSHPRLQVHVHLDLLRSTRPEPTSSASALLPLVNEFPGRFSVYLFKSPTLKAPLSYIVPRRIDEGWGTWHVKSYVADDDIILSGANLNESYFSNRQDRYLYFTSSPPLSEYIVDFLKLFSQFSHGLYSHETHGSPILHWQNSQVKVENLGDAARERILNFHARRKTFSQETDTVVFPIVQAGYMGIHQEEDCLEHLFHHIEQLPDASSAVIDLTSGYFALHKRYQYLLIHSPVKARVVAAGPKANGFFGSDGLSGRIPEGYMLLLRRFWERVLQAHGPESSAKIEISEWEKIGWTYHAKGLWYRPQISSAPELTLFGSSNLNTRSARLDTELSFLMSTNSADLRTQLDEEFYNLKKDARVLQQEDWENPSRRVRVGTQMIVASGVGNCL